MGHVDPAERGQDCWRTTIPLECCEGWRTVYEPDDSQVGCVTITQHCVWCVVESMLRETLPKDSQPPT